MIVAKDNENYTSVVSFRKELNIIAYITYD